MGLDTQNVKSNGLGRLLVHAMEPCYDERRLTNCKWSLKYFRRLAYRRLFVRLLFALTVCMDFHVLFKDNQIHWPSLLLTERKKNALMWTRASLSEIYFQFSSERIWPTTSSLHGEADTQRKFHSSLLYSETWFFVLGHLVITAWTWHVLKIRFRYPKIAFLFSSESSSSQA